MKQLLVFLFVLCAASVSAQDVIVKKDGSTILSKVLEVGQEEIKYKKYDNLEGPTYTIQKSELQAINYQNGAKDTFSAPIRDENRYLPNNQNDGTQQYNDRALLGMDYNMNKKYKRTRNIAWIGGAVLVGAGAIVFLSDDVSETNIIGAGLAAGGVAWTTTFLFLANRYNVNNKAYLSSTPIYQQNIKISDVSSLSVGADLLCDNTIGNKTLGLGLRYNF